jgi:hypothetical protein
MIMMMTMTMTTMIMLLLIKMTIMINLLTTVHGAEVGFLNDVEADAHPPFIQVHLQYLHIHQHIQSFSHAHRYSL